MNCAEEAAESLVLTSIPLRFSQRVVTQAARQKNSSYNTNRRKRIVVIDPITIADFGSELTEADCPSHKWRHNSSAGKERGSFHRQLFDGVFSSMYTLLTN